MSEKIYCKLEIELHICNYVFNLLHLFLTYGKFGKGNMDAFIIYQTKSAYLPNVILCIDTGF
jgi:hypothetical protein